MDGKRFGTGLLVGLLVGILVVASPGLAGLGALGAPPATDGVGQTSTRTIYTQGETSYSNMQGSVSPGSENSSSTSTATRQSTGPTDSKAAGGNRGPSSLNNFASQPAVLDGLVLLPLILAFILGAILYSASNRRLDNDRSR